MIEHIDFIVFIGVIVIVVVLVWCLCDRVDEDAIKAKKRMNTLRDYVDERSLLSDTSSKAWGEMGDDEQKAYRLGMVYAYLDMRRQLGPKEGI